MRRKARQHLLAFIEYTHPSWTTEPHHEKVCRYLELLEQRAACPYCGRTIDKLANFAPPRSGKTEISLRRFTAWCLGRHPSWNVISAMANGSLASDTGGEIRDIVASPEFAALFPEVKLQADAKAANRWVVNSGRQRGVFYTAGVDASFPGRGSNLLNIDDPHKSAQEADSQRMRDLAAKFYFGDAVQRLESPAMQILTNTRRHMDDLAGRILPQTKEWLATEDPQFFCCKNGWHVLRIRAIEDEDTDHEQAIRNRACVDIDALAYMKSVRELYRTKSQSRYWSSEYQQEPALEEGTYTQRQWFSGRYVDIPEAYRAYIASDYAVSSDKDGGDPDYTEHGVFGIAPDRKIYVLDWWHGRTNSDVWVEELLNLVEKWEPFAVFGEKGQIKKAVGPFLQRRKTERHIFFREEYIASTADKVTRGRAFQAMAASGQILFPGTEWAQRVIDQCVNFPSGDHDDAFDVMSLICLALDKTHPAMAPSPGLGNRHDRWQVNKNPSKSWKTV